MRQVPPLSELRWLEGDRLDIVSTAEFTLWFAFDSAGVVQVDDAVELVDANGISEVYDPQTRQGPWLFHRIVGCAVRSVTRPDDWTIGIAFENGSRLIVRSSDGSYESGRIRVPGGKPQETRYF